MQKLELLCVAGRNVHDTAAVEDSVEVLKCDR